MKRILSGLRKAKGFTLIELLVVIGILGILAAALIATIDPFEQLKKGRDTTARTAAVDYLNALTRYYATNGKFPWQITVAPCATPVPSGGMAATLDSVAACTTILESSGELKLGYGTAIAGSGAGANIRIRAGVGSDVSICFAPTSKAMKGEANSKYTDDCDPAQVQPAATCPLPGAADNTCFQLFK